MDKQALNAALTEYEKVERSARAEYRKVRDSARAEYEKVVVSARTKYEKIRDSAWAEYEKVRDSAWSRIAEESGDHLVSWIIQNASDHQEQALLVLRSLPASLPDLDDLAEGNGWCEAWEDLRSRAIEAGVVSE